MIDEYLAFARELALAAGNLMREGFDRPTGIRYKADGSPVTDIDIRVNQMVAERIRRQYPGHALLGEEADVGTGSESHRWICDPLDGTVPYILGVPSSLFMLALMEESVLLVATAYDPFADRLYHAARHGGAFCNGSRIHVSNQTLSEGYVVLGADSPLFSERIRQAGGRAGPVPGSGYKAMMIARGKAVGTLRQTADFHDVAPAALIVAEAGGRVTALDGGQLAFDRKGDGGAIISNKIAHQALVNAVSG